MVLLRMGPIGCPEMSVQNYHYSLRNNSEECSSQLVREAEITLSFTFVAYLWVCGTELL